MRKNRQIILISILIGLSTGLWSQTTEVIKKTSIYSNPNDPKSVIGKIYPGSEIRKIRKDESGNYIKAVVEFYIPVESLKEGRVSKRIGEMQTADDAAIKLLQARRDGNEVHVSINITNNGSKNIDMSALLLIQIIAKGENIGNLEFMRSKNSVGIIKPGKTLRSELIYSFKKTPKDVELVFQSKMRGDQVFYQLGF